MATLYKAYVNWLMRYPIASQAIQTGILMGACDVISQTVVENCPINKLNYVRTLQFAGVGTFFVGPVVRVWYGVLQKFIGTGGKTVAFKKTAFDQIVFAPTCLAACMSIIKITQGHSLSETKSEVEKVYLEVLLANYKIWPMVQIVNFCFVPLHYQVLVVQFVALFWNTYLSYKTKPSTESGV